MSTTMLKRDLGTGDLCNHIGLIGVSAKWSYVTALASVPGLHRYVIAQLNFAEVEHLKSGKAWAQTSCEVDVR